MELHFYVYKSLGYMYKLTHITYRTDIYTFMKLLKQKNILRLICEHMYVWIEWENKIRYMMLSFVYIILLYEIRQINKYTESWMLLNRILRITFKDYLYLILKSTVLFESVFLFHNFVYCWIVYRSIASKYFEYFGKLRFTDVENLSSRN